MKRTWSPHSVLALVGAALALAGCTQSGPMIGGTTAALGTEVVLDDFTTVTAVNHPGGAGIGGVWYDATQNTFGTPSAAMLEGQPALRIDDGGFTNGVYTIYEGAIPQTGTYRISARVQVVETATGTDGIRAYQMGVATGVDASHRGPNPSALPALGLSADVVGLTPGDDTALGVQTLLSPEFNAVAGEDLLVAFGTDVTSGAWNGNAGFFNGSHVLVGSLELIPSELVDVVDDDEGAPRFTTSAPWAVSGGVGFGGGHYRFASATTGPDATWLVDLEPGNYRAEVYYRGGTNRASAAHYEITAGDSTQTFRLDQRLHSLNWVDIGGIEVEAGDSVSVTLSASLSTPAGRVVIADAVRFVPTDAPTVDDPEMRVAAVTVFDLVDEPGAISSLVDEIAGLGYNAIAVHARYRGDATYFPNRTDTRYPNQDPRRPALGSLDLLEEFIQSAHAKNLKVFAYVNTHLVTDGSDTAADPDHVVNTHPEWLTYTYNGGSPVVQTTADDVEGLWLEPSLPEVRAHIADVIGDIARNYDIDGVILDRIRYPQTTFTRPNRDFGYHPRAIAHFNARYHKTGIPDPYDEDWIEYRQQRITRTVRDIARRLRHVNPDLTLLAYPIGRFNDAIRFNYQDWPEWMRTRIVDGVLPQIYTSDLATFGNRIETHTNAYGGDRLLGVTINAFSAGIDVEGQIQTARALGLAGSSPFRQGTLEGLGYIADLRSAWSGPAEWPAMPWKSHHIRSLDLEPVCDSASDEMVRWTVNNPNSWAIEVSWRSFGSDEAGSYWAPPGESEFETTQAGWWPGATLTWRDSWWRERQDFEGLWQCRPRHGHGHHGHHGHHGRWQHGRR